jgi:hypothetical protein
METTLTPQIDLDGAAERRGEEERRVHEWRVDQLRRLGVARSLAEGFAGAVDWHDVAALVRRGCPPVLALEIAY